ncbi:MAG: sulfatase-like hydrolase/transferase, partial [Candidatus Eremiobacteraeota bacterium]|nr:sulfatase-like hydrolase/transferase [Candidatus Eremiobacteraeota bacterium]
IRMTFWFSFSPFIKTKLCGSSIYRVDQYLGRLMDELRHLKLLDKTLIIILGDHGEDIWDHEDFGHCEMYEEVLHVPLIFYNLPGIPPGSIFENLVSLLDLFPTLIKIHKLTPTQALSVDGIDLSPLFQKTLLPPRKIFSECWVSSDPDNINQKDISVIDENYHYIRRFEQTTLSILREQLYFIPNDPLEQRDIAKLLPKKLKTYQTLTDNFLSKISSPKEKDAPPEKLPYSGEEESKLMDKLKALGYF